MTRLRSLPISIVAVLVCAGVAAAVSMPSAATRGLSTATEHSGRTVPAVPDTTGLSLEPQAEPAAEEDSSEADLPEAAAHGAAVSEAAQAEDSTADTNHGADVSAVARDNHGQAVAESHVPEDAGPPDEVGPPADAGQPDDAGRPAGVGKP
jgi:hypothetical protein